jgi:pimeloyl-ACP methyl ester carboxylesterase
VAARDQARICAKEWEVLRVRLVGRPEAAQHLPDPCGYPNEWPRHLQVHFRASFGSVQRLALPAERLRAIRSPVLVIHGTWDRNAPYGGGRQWALELPDARLLTIPGAAHAPWADHGTEVTLALTRFLDGQWPDGAERVTRLVP